MSLHQDLEGESWAKTERTVIDNDAAIGLKSYKRWQS
jgi:hypothetical protein